MKHVIFAILFALGFVVGTAAQGAWGPRGCSVEQAALFTGWSGNAYFTDGKLTGYYRDTEWYPYTEGFGYGAATTPPWVKVTGACKCGVCKCKTCRCGDQTAAGFLFGVEASRLHKDGRNRYSITGRPVQRHEALAALQLQDDSAKPFVTFIGTGATQAATAFQSLPAAQTARVHGYDAGHWATQCGFVNGSPMVYVQDAKGAVLYRKDNPPIADVVNEVRKAQPDYNPAHDPNGQAPTISLNQLFSSIPAYVWGIVGGVLALLFARRNS